MKLTKKILEQMIKEEHKNLTEGLKRFKVYVSGESEPLILMGKNEKEVKQTAHMMIKNSSVKIRKVVKEGKLNEGFSDKKVNPKMRQILADLGEKNPAQLMNTLWAVVK